MANEPEIKKLTGYVSLVYMWALLYACIGLFTYYNHFSVNIFQYLDLTELIQISLSKFAITTLLLIVSLFLSLVGDELKDKNQDPLDAGPVSNFKVFAYPLYFCGLAAIISGWLESATQDNTILSEITTFLIVACCALLPIYLSLYYIYTRKEKKEVLTVLAIILVTSSCIISVAIGRHQYENIKEYALVNTVFVGERPIASSKHYYYIGHTRNYVFYYNDTLKVTDVYPASSVSKMTLK